MKPVSKSDMECHKKFEYHEKLKRRFKDQEEEEETDGVHRFANPAFRLEVERGDDAATYDCRCEAKARNFNAVNASANMCGVKRTSNHYMLRKHPADSSGPRVAASASHIVRRGGYAGMQNRNAAVCRGASTAAGFDEYSVPPTNGRRGTSRSNNRETTLRTGGCCNCGVVLSKESIDVELTTTTTKKCVQRSTCDRCHCDREWKRECACGKPHPKMERIDVEGQDANAALRRDPPIPPEFNPLIRYTRKEREDCGCGPPDYPADSSGLRAVPATLRTRDEPLMLPYPRERVPIEIFERYVREKESGFGW